MAKPILRYRQGDQFKWAELAGAAPTSAQSRVEVRPLDVDCTTTAALIAGLDQGLASQAPVIEISGADLVSPITDDAALFCQGLNYADHANEASHAARKSNLLFAKASSSLTGPYDVVVRPKEVELLDYEVEFALVMRTALNAESQVDDGNIGQFVAGVVLCNDVSSRDVQFGESLLQWFRGKSFRTFCPAGPILWLYDREEVADALQNLGLSLWVNGDLRQRASSRQLIFKPVETLNYIASMMDMRSGDLLLTGTPGGVTAAVTPRMIEILKTHLFADEQRRDELRVEMKKGRPFLAGGDVMTASLVDVRTGENMGGLENKIVDAAG